MRRPDLDLHAERQSRILAAAEQVFAREGFHQTSMPTIAAEARMSPANLYRYFELKDAIIEAFAEHERSAVRAELAALSEAPDLVDGLVALIGRYLSERKDELAVALEIAAEACRNPRIATILEAIERDARTSLTAIIEAAKAKGQVDQAVDTQAAITLLVSLADGLGWRRIVDAGFRRAPTIEALRILLGRFLRPSHAAERAV